MEDILKLKPERVFYYFNEICKVPRPSKKEEKIVAWLINIGEKLGLATKRDKIGNVLISKPATKGKEGVTPIIFQSHVDMVCEKNNDTVFDFATDAIQPYIDGDWLKAKGTTLGADDGIGMALALALLEDTQLKHGPIECLFTVDEETGLTGAFALEAGFMNGKILINLDSEDEGEFFIGCAGGKGISAFFDCEYEDIPYDDAVGFTLTIGGLQGGHSGDDINKGRGNAIKLLARILWNAYHSFELRIASINAGNLHNAIPREGEAIVVIPKESIDEFREYVEEMNQTYKNEYRVTDPNVFVALKEVEAPEEVLEEILQFDLLNVLQICQHGVVDMSQDIPNFVETSTNLASVKMTEEQIVIATSQRSSVESKKQYIVECIDATLSMLTPHVEHSDGYPGWTPNPNSPALKLLEAAYEKIFNKKPAVKAIHAGLECGLFSEKYPDLDMVSIGPTLRGVHSPDEKLEIKTVQMCWDLIVEFLDSIA